MNYKFKIFSKFGTKNFNYLFIIVSDNINLRNKKTRIIR